MQVDFHVNPMENQNQLSPPLLLTLRTLVPGAAFAGAGLIIGVPAGAAALVGACIGFTSTCLDLTGKVNDLVSKIFGLGAGFAVAKGLGLSAYTFNVLFLYSFGVAIGMFIVAVLATISGDILAKKVFLPGHFNQ